MMVHSAHVNAAISEFEKVSGKDIEAKFQELGVEPAIAGFVHGEFKVNGDEGRSAVNGFLLGTLAGRRAVYDEARAAQEAPPAPGDGQMTTDQDPALGQPGVPAQPQQAQPQQEQPA